MFQPNIDQLTAGAESLTNNKLSASQIKDLVSKFRSFLSHLAKNYPLQSTFEALEDNATDKDCAKLAACLLEWEDLGADNGGFAATMANKTGYNNSVDVERFYIFVYAFTLFWDLPADFENRFMPSSRNLTSDFGRFSNTYGG